MILPIVAYGSKVLHQKASSLTPAYAALPQLLEDMWHTLDHAKGVGLAAPQVNYSLELFIINSHSEAVNLTNGLDAFSAIRQAFLNPVILYYSKEQVLDQEGCLSIPGIQQFVPRAQSITVQYQDEHFQTHIDAFQGTTARIIQHEYDHLQGRLYTEYLPPLQKRLLQKKLLQISKGNIIPPYPMRFS